MCTKSVEQIYFDIWHMTWFWFYLATSKSLLIIDSNSLLDIYGRHEQALFSFWKYLLQENLRLFIVEPINPKNKNNEIKIPLGEASWKKALQWCIIISKRDDILLLCYHYHSKTSHIIWAFISLEKKNLL